MTTRILKLENRAVLRLSGAETVSFLNGLVTNDVELVKDGAVYGALLTPQGKFLFDMIIVADGDDLLLDIEAERKPQLLQRLMMYKLRADVEISEEDASVWALIGGDADFGVQFKDPRHKALQSRVISKDNPSPDAEVLAQTDYEERRIRHGVPDGSRDMMVEKYFWLETNAEKINGVSFTKGCFVGQELTARMKHRTTLKKMITPVKVSGPVEAGAEIKTSEGKNAGTIHTSANGYALAYMRLEHLESELVAGDIAVSANLRAD
jgi:folate-binding protein YgfZ